MAKEYIITADSKPDLDEWGWDDYWTILHWIDWHKKMKAKYGLNEANKTFMYWWDQQTIGASILDARSFNTDFRNYAKKNGFFDALFGGASVLKVIGAGSDVISGGSEVASSVVQAGVNVGKMLKWVVPTLLITALAGLGIYAYKQYLK